MPNLWTPGQMRLTTDGTATFNRAGGHDDSCPLHDQSGPHEVRSLGYRTGQQSDIMFKTHSGEKVVLNGETYYIINEADYDGKVAFIEHCTSKSCPVHAERNNGRSDPDPEC
jgi:hypothetical protein